MLFLKKLRLEVIIVDLSFLKLDFKSQMSCVRWQWQDLLFGLDNGIINSKDVIYYATELVKNDNSIMTEDIIALASLGFQDDAYPILKKILVVEHDSYAEETRDKWIFVVLRWLYSIRESHVDIPNALEDIYEVFGYPQQIADFCQFTAHLGDFQKNRVEIYKAWKKFIEEREEYYACIQ